MGRNYKKYILWATVIFIAIYFTYSIVQGLKKSQAALSEILNSDDKLSPYDSSLFKADVMRNITVFEVLQSKIRNPISIVFYKENNIIFYRIDLYDSKSNGSFINIIKKASKRTRMESYRLIEQHDYLNISAKAGAILPASKIYFSYDGYDFETEIENDSIMSYRFICKNFSLKYDKEGAVDFLVQRKYRLLNRPINILFWRRENSVYVFFMTPGKKEGTLEGESLLDVINLVK